MQYVIKNQSFNATPARWESLAVHGGSFDIHWCALNPSEPAVTDDVDESIDCSQELVADGVTRGSVCKTYCWCDVVNCS